MIMNRIRAICMKSEFFCVAEGKTLWAAKRELWLLSKLNYLQGSLEKLRVDNMSRPFYLIRVVPAEGAFGMEKHMPFGHVLFWQESCRDYIKILGGTTENEPENLYS